MTHSLRWVEGGDIQPSISTYTLSHNIWSPITLLTNLYHTQEIFGRGPNHTGKSYWRGKFWRISYSQCIRMPNTYIFSVSL